MPKVMMIGKVSKLGRRTRKAGSFKGMLGTVVLEGSRAKSRRYGMGNIAGSPAEHANFELQYLAEATKSLATAQQETECRRRIRFAFHAINDANQALAESAHARPEHRGKASKWRTADLHSTRAGRMIVEAQQIIGACVAGSKGVSGARRRR